MALALKNSLDQYVHNVREIYGNYLKRIILFGSVARGDFCEDSDVDIMILLDLSDEDIKAYRHQLSDMTFDYNLCNGVDIKPIAKSEKHFLHWVDNYPFYAIVNKEGVTLYGGE